MEVETGATSTEIGTTAVGPFIPPPMTIAQYAKLQGVTIDTINNQIRRGYVPTIKTGKRRLINTFALAVICLNID